LHVPGSSDFFPSSLEQATAAKDGMAARRVPRSSHRRRVLSLLIDDRMGGPFMMFI
jgi:hypothetical protein